MNPSSRSPTAPPRSHRQPEDPARQQYQGPQTHASRPPPLHMARPTSSHNIRANLPLSLDALRRMSANRTFRSVVHPQSYTWLRPRQCPFVPDPTPALALDPRFRPRAQIYSHPASISALPWGLPSRPPLTSPVRLQPASNQQRPTSSPLSTCACQLTAAPIVHPFLIPPFGLFSLLWLQRHAHSAMGGCYAIKRT